MGTKGLILAVLASGLLAVWASPLVGQETAEPETQKAAQRIAEQAALKAVEKVAQNAQERKAADEAEAAQKQQIIAQRPSEWWGATEVGYVIFVVDIDGIDGASQSFAANVYVRLRWKDPW